MTRLATLHLVKVYDQLPYMGAAVQNIIDVAATTVADRLLWRMIQRFGSEKSDSAIVTEILGFTGQRYSEGKTVLEKLRREFGS